MFLSREAPGCAGEYIKSSTYHQYEEAIVAFQDMEGYRDSDAKFDELLELIDFTNGKEIKLSNDYTFRRFLLGRWEEVQKGFYFFELQEKDDGSNRIEYNLPHPESNGYYRFEDGVISFRENTSSAPDTKVFRISITGKDTVSIYCYKNDESYRTEKNPLNLMLIIQKVGGRKIHAVIYGIEVSSPLWCYPAKTICSWQSRQAMFTVFVARTELRQQGQIYFRLLDVLGGKAIPVPSCVSVPVTL